MRLTFLSLIVSIVFTAGCANIGTRKPASEQEFHFYLECVSESGVADTFEIVPEKSRFTVVTGENRDDGKNSVYGVAYLRLKKSGRTVYEAAVGVSGDRTADRAMINLVGEGNASKIVLDIRESIESSVWTTKRIAPHTSEGYPYFAFCKRAS